MAHHSTAFIQEVAKSRSVAGETIVVIPCPTQVVVSEHGLHELCSGDLMELGPYTQVNPLPTNLLDVLSLLCCRWWMVHTDGLIDSQVLNAPLFQEGTWMFGPETRMLP